MVRLENCTRKSSGPRHAEDPDIEADLLQRRDYATANGWKGEIEGIDLTPTFLRSKRTQTHRAVSLGHDPERGSRSLAMSDIRACGLTRPRRLMVWRGAPRPSA
jgi:hypothetical protein